MILRRDRTRNGGGIAIYVKNGYKIISKNINSDIEMMHISIKVKKREFNFISCYNPPSENKKDFLDKLEDLIFSLDLSQPIFILGDLNMDLNNENNNPLFEFLKNTKLNNAINAPTRIRSSYCSKTNHFQLHSAILDVLIHNTSNIINKINIIGCPFSDHEFITAELNIERIKQPSSNYVFLRNLSKDNIIKINGLLENNDFELPETDNDVESIWLKVKKFILNILDSIAPVKRVKIHHDNNFPWFDSELIKIKNQRDSFYKKFKKDII